MDRIHYLFLSIEFSHPAFDKKLIKTDFIFAQSFREAEKIQSALFTPYF